MATKALNLYQRLAAIAADTPYAQKLADTGRYMTTTHDSVTALLREPFEKHGVMIISGVENQSHELREVETRRGKKLMSVGMYRVSVCFINIDEPSEQHSTFMDVEGHDQADKAGGKAYSTGLRMILLKTFRIVTGDNEESEFEYESVDSEEAEAEEEDPTVAMAEQLQTALDYFAEQFPEAEQPTVPAKLTTEAQYRKAIAKVVAKGKAARAEAEEADVEEDDDGEAEE